MRAATASIDSSRAADELGWSAEKGLRDTYIVLVGGANGSGKTTLLEGLFSVFNGPGDLDDRPVFPGADELRLDLRVSSEIFPGTRDLCLAIGDVKFVEAQQKTEDFYAIARDERQRNSLLMRSPAWRAFDKAAFDWERYGDTDLPRVLYFPSDRRLNFPRPKDARGASSLSEDGSLLSFLGGKETMGLRFAAAKRYEDSLVALLHAARWNDLNAKDEGRPEDAIEFAGYVDAFHRFMGGGKQLTWHRGELRVRMADGTLHDLPELSSGEKQILIFAAEIRKAWIPGSLILIDEPELHLHEAWQTTLFELLRDLQRERGGQVILATQSNHLFGLGEPGSQVVLRKDWP